MMGAMSEMPRSSTVPTWTVGDRMRKALTVAGLSVGEMCDYLGLSRNTVSSYMNDRQAPKRQTLAAWAMRTGQPLEWIETGEEPTSGPPSPPEGPKGGRNDNELAHLTAQKASRARGTSSGANNRRYVAAA